MDGFIRENPIQIDDLEVPPFVETPHVEKFESI